MMKALLQDKPYGEIDVEKRNLLYILLWLFGTSLFCLVLFLYIQLYRIITYEFPDPPSYNNPAVHEEREMEKQKEEKRNIQAGQLANRKTGVREIPFSLEPYMEAHLREFRNKAQLLNQEFPDSFLISTDETKKTIALTFDDGPDDKATLEIVNILNSYEVPGTFFLIGNQINRHPDIVQAIIDSGHKIANHSWSHKRPTDISTNEMLEEAENAWEIISSYDSFTRLYRPPYGLVNRSQMPALIEAGYKVVCWSIDSMDWYFDSPEKIAACVTETAHPGAIVLMHSAGGLRNRQATIEALPIIIEKLMEEGYEFISL
ncbi:MAG: polysaccharide deacetylase family protein [Clostridiales bacterium]|nr:polysaccharide deacetylase family protein [Clostridiales bacterium]